MPGWFTVNDRRLGAATALVVLLAAGCRGGSGKPSSTTTVPPGRTSTSGPAGSVTTNPGGTASQGKDSRPTPTSRPPSLDPTLPIAGLTGVVCTTADLAGSLADLGAAAGTDYQELLFKNISSAPCTTAGYPEVSFVDAHGSQIGASLPEIPGPTARVVLVRGASAAAMVAYHDGYLTSGPSCQPTAAAGLRVFPPDQTAALIVPTTLVVCGNTEATGTAAVSPLAAASSVHPG
jgi:uncharacterized protein DUF4232